MDITPKTILKYRGHSSFEYILPSGKSILIDPYKNSLFSKWFLKQFPKTKTDVLLISHPHFDHSAIERIESSEIIDSETIKEIDDCKIYVIQGHHARPTKYSWWFLFFFGHKNLIFIFEINGVRLCHWGDNDSNLYEKLLQNLGSIDVLLLPVDESEHLLTLEEVEMISEKLSPKVVVPTHYLIPELTSPKSTLKSIDNWLKQKTNVKYISQEGIEISKDVLPSSQEVWVFQPIL